MERRIYVAVIKQIAVRNTQICRTDTEGTHRSGILVAKEGEPWEIEF